MIQEIITYIIVGGAVFYAVLKIFQKSGIKKKTVKKINKVDYKNENFTMQHNCSDCSAECMLRNATKPMIEKNKELCHEIEIRQKLQKF